MNYLVTSNGEIDFAPKTEVEEILQNVRTILSTLQGTVPLYRDFGVSWEHIDKPLSLAKTMNKEAIIEAIEEYEPRAKLVSVEYDDNEIDMMNGLLACRVIVSIGNEEEEEW